MTLMPSLSRRALASAISGVPSLLTSFALAPCLSSKPTSSALPRLVRYTSSLLRSAAAQAEPPITINNTQKTADNFLIIPVNSPLTAGQKAPYGFQDSIITLDAGNMTEKNEEKLKFSAEISKVLQLMIHSLYTNK